MKPGLLHPQFVWGKICAATTTAIAAAAAYVCCIVGPSDGRSVRYCMIHGMRPVVADGEWRPEAVLSHSPGSLHPPSRLTPHMKG